MAKREKVKNANPENEHQLLYKYTTLSHIAPSPVVFVCDISHRVNDRVIHVRCGNRKVVKQLHQFSGGEVAVVAFNADAFVVDLQA